MGNWFGSKHKDKQPLVERKQDRITDADRAMLDLKAQKDQLVIHRRKLEALIPKDIAAAKLFIEQKKKQLALLALRKKKQHEQMVEQCYNHLHQVEEMIAQCENAQMQQNFVQALAAGNSALKQFQKEVTIDSVQQLKDDMDEAAAHVQEIDQLLCAAGIPQDDEAVLAELARIEEEEALEISAQVPSAPVTALPTVAAAETEKEEEREKEQVQILVADDSTGLNNGVFLMRASGWTDRFLAKWWDSYSIFDHTHNCSDQASMEYILIHDRSLAMAALPRTNDPNRDEIPVWPPQVRLVPQKHMNSFHYATAQAVISREWEEGDFIMHFPGCHYYREQCQELYRKAESIFFEKVKRLIEGTHAHAHGGEL
eukprot:GDKI01034481.1.p1 GENE.GDKI01034481.1~~GDKI01034481.1.p1  ORF type:complete len:370 (-),score=100.41 GDKI01034481.1:599-1708(-)